MRSCLRNLPGNRWLTIAGQTGCGKTHCATKIKAYYDSRKIDAWAKGMLRVSCLADAMFEHWPTIAMVPEPEFRAVVADMQDSHLVLLDDIGAECDAYKSGEATTRLLRVLTACKSKWLYATTNVPPAMWKQRFDSRVCRRLMDGAFISLFDVPVYAKKGDSK